MKQPLLWFALACHVVLSTLYLLGTPAWEGPDENDHGYYAYYLRATGQPPIIKASARVTGRGEYEEASLGHHPPLYYGLLAVTMGSMGRGDFAPAWRGNPDGIAQHPEWLEPGVDWAAEHPVGAFHWVHGADELAPISPEIVVLRWMRAWSVLFGAATVLLTWCLGRALFPEAPAIAGLGALVLACVPQWSFMHGVLDNGNLAAALAHAALLLLVMAVRSGALTAGTGLGFGVLCGLGIMTKMTALFLLPVAACAWGVALMKWPDRRRQTLRSGIMAVVVIGALSGWIVVRNYGLYGEPLGTAAHRTGYAGNMVPNGELISWLVGDFPRLTAQSAVGSFGWAALPLPGTAMLVVGILVALALLGFAVRFGTAWQAAGPALLVALLGALVATAAFVQFNLTFRQPQGRYLFPVYGVFALVLAAGLILPVRGWWRGGGLRSVVVLSPLPIAAFCAHILVFAPVFDAANAPADRWYASMVAGVATPPESGRPVIEQTDPPDGTATATPPTFRWVSPDHRAGHRYTVHLRDAQGRWIMPVYEWAGQVIERQEWAFPPAIWNGLAPGEAMEWKVRRLPDRAAGETVADVPESSFRRLVRVE